MQSAPKTICCTTVMFAALMLPGTWASAETIFESFEGNLGPWRSNAYTPLGWHVTPSRATALDGQWSLDFTANGLADDGTVWVVRELQLTPGTWTIGLEFNVTGGGPLIGQWTGIGFIGLREPMNEADFTQSPEGENFGALAGFGWVTYSMERTYTVAEPTVAYVAFGYTIVFEVFHTYHFDAATVTGAPVQCGNGQCFAGENPCNCPADCGPPAATETICDDGLDDDCEGFADCVDSDCSADPACAGITCDGDFVCESGEEGCVCWMDCGPPPVMESSCGDGLDDDCDGMTDCADWWECSLAPECMTSGCDMDGVCETDEDCNNCPSDCISGGGTICGNGVCEPAGGEDCLSCATDCNGKQGGKPTSRFCCGDGDGENPVGCDDARCSSEGFSCSPDPAPTFCCGDGVCEGQEDGVNCEIDCGPPPVCGDANCDPGEDQCNCPADCGTPPSTETACDDGIDNDCDGPADCDDSDCTGDPACPSCLAKGQTCTSNAECCSNWCHRGACK